MTNSQWQRCLKFITAQRENTDEINRHTSRMMIAIQSTLSQLQLRLGKSKVHGLALFGSDVLDGDIVDITKFRAVYHDRQMSDVFKLLDQRHSAHYNNEQKTLIVNTVNNSANLFFMIGQIDTRIAHLFVFQSIANNSFTLQPL